MTPTRPPSAAELPPLPGRDQDADPDVDGVALAAAAAAGVVLGTRFVAAAAWVAVALCLAAACLGAATAPRPREGPVDAAVVGGTHGPMPGGGGGAVVGAGGGGAAGDGPGAVVGVLVLGVLVASGAAAASLRATAVRGGVLVGWIGQPGRVEVAATVAEEPRRLRFGGYWMVLTVHRVQRGGRTFSTRERAGVVRSPTGPAVGDRLRLRASVTAARWSDRLGRQPPVLLRHPVVEERAPPRSPVLRVSELVRESARRRALATLAPERAGLLVGMALGDTSLLPAEVERDFRAAGLTHLMAVSGANLVVVLAAGLWLAGAAGAGRRMLAAVGILLVVVLVVVTRWEPSVLRAGVMAGLVLVGVATGRGPGGRRALCLAVVVLLLADPGLAGALGFQLSVAATAGVLWLGPAAARALPDRIPERVRTAVGMTLGAQATAAPALALALGPVSLAGLPANLLGLPLAGVA